MERSGLEQRAAAQFTLYCAGRFTEIKVDLLKLPEITAIAISR